MKKVFLLIVMGCFLFSCDMGLQQARDEVTIEAVKMGYCYAKAGKTEEEAVNKMKEILARR